MLFSRDNLLHSFNVPLSHTSSLPVQPPTFTGAHSKGLLEQSGVNCHTDSRVSGEGEHYSLSWCGDLKNLWLSNKWTKRIHSLFHGNRTSTKQRKKSKHDNASSTRLMLRIPVITECFFAHIIQDTSSYHGEHHPDQICVYLSTKCQQGLLE